jgi:death-on-curing protein
LNATPDNCFHVTVEMARELHAEAIAEFGGSDGIREPALLESAILAPQATFEGRSPFHDMAEVTAAYLFYLCTFHPFVDANKRTALGACIVFLRLNGLEPAPDGRKWEQLTLEVAAGRIDREQTTQHLRKLLRKQNDEPEFGS